MAEPFEKATHVVGVEHEAQIGKVAKAISTYAKLRVKDDVGINSDKSRKIWNDFQLSFGLNRSISESCSTVLLPCGTVLYDSKVKLPLLAIEHLKSELFSNNDKSRPEFYVDVKSDQNDPQLKLQFAEFKENGFHLGHTMPIANHRGDPEAFGSIMNIKQIIPQNMHNNSIACRSVEGIIRGVTLLAGNAFVITGIVPSKDESGGVETFGSFGVAKVGWIYKICAIPREHDNCFDVVCFCLPNKPIAMCDVLNFRCLFGELEEICGSQPFDEETKRRLFDHEDASIDARIKYCLNVCRSFENCKISTIKEAVADICVGGHFAVSRESGSTLICNLCIDNSCNSISFDDNTSIETLYDMTHAHKLVNHPSKCYLTQTDYARFFEIETTDIKNIKIKCIMKHQGDCEFKEPKLVGQWLNAAHRMKTHLIYLENKLAEAQESKRAKLDEDEALG